ncbi:MAG: hypothetical protein M1840_002869 [Geoglossum simile]|nr:MAG: hypothetical protein M1840_002869 [Geoglossum simile]
MESTVSEPPVGRQPAWESQSNAANSSGKPGERFHVSEGKGVHCEGIKTSVVDDNHFVRFLFYLAANGVAVIKRSELVEKSEGESAGGASMDVREAQWGRRIVALKFLRRDKVPSRTTFGGFRNQSSEYRRILNNMEFEVQVMAHKPLCDHRNIVHLLGVAFEDRYTKLLQMEVFEPILVVPFAAMDLERFCSSLTTGTAGYDELANLMSDIADGLHALHMYGIVHADMKPANVLLFQDDVSTPGRYVAKLSDFGFCGSEEHELPPGGHTLIWAAPECYDESLRNYRNQPFRDIYSFGLVCAYIALEGRWDMMQECQKTAPALCEDVQRLVLNHFTSRPEAQLRRILEILKTAIQFHPEERTLKLQVVRENLLGFDQFKEENALFYTHLIPFRGRKGWLSEMHGYVRLSRSSKPVNAITEALPKTLQLILSAHLLLALASKPPSFWDVRIDTMCGAIGPEGRAGYIGRLLSTLLMGMWPDNIGIESGQLRLYLQPNIEQFLSWRLSDIIGVPALRDAMRPFEHSTPPTKGQKPQLFMAAETGDVDELFIILRDYPQLMRSLHGGVTIAHSGTRHLNILIVLVSIDPLLVHWRDSMGNTPLHHSVMYHRPECVYYLLLKGADPSATNEYGWTPLQMAYCYASRSVMFNQGHYHERAKHVLRHIRAAGDNRDEVLLSVAILEFFTDSLTLLFFIGAWITLLISIYIIKRTPLLSTLCIQLAPQILTFLPIRSLREGWDMAKDLRRRVGCLWHALNAHPLEWSTSEVFRPCNGHGIKIRNIRLSPDMFFLGKLSVPEAAKLCRETAELATEYTALAAC